MITNDIIKISKISTIFYIYNEGVLILLINRLYQKVK